MKGKTFFWLLIFGLLLSPLSPSVHAANLFGYDEDLEPGKINFGGYIDTYITYSENLDAQYNGLEAEKTDFTVDRAELFIQHRATDTLMGYLEASITGLSDETDLTLDEAYLEVVLPAGAGLKLTGGVFDVPIGIGANENLDIWNWQFKMTNLLVAPWSFTGGMAEYSVADIDFTAWVANGWGYSEAYGLRPVGRVDPDTEKTYGGRIGFSPEGIVDTGISVVHGNEKRELSFGPNAGDLSPLQSRTMVDWDFRWQNLPGWLNALDFEAWWLGVDDTPQVETGGDLGDSDAYGLVVQTNFQTGWDMFSVSVGYEIIEEEDGIVFGANPLTEIPTEEQTRQSLEITPIWAINDNMLTDVSLRMDWSNEDVFMDDKGDAEDSSWLVAWEWYFIF